jgi:hypothetical protein
MPKKSEKEAVVAQDGDDPHHPSGTRAKAHPTALRVKAGVHQRDARMRLPPEIIVYPDGSAVAGYGGDPLLRYSSLAALLADHGLSADDVEPAHGATRSARGRR